ncbi:4-oxalomesaconate tautomerase [Telmatospirillum sp. J64-1]|uniref:4-oxalomesaconate tautomerase n=1 Tax=Telmatospirillum sp. J64-1 TaxID=2502183 RepID=UPI00115EB96A|nr:4-oxalomesaconate tautomerase [Telmatospirillum sp. J64-1]
MTNLTNDLIAIPSVLMRGGTSKGPLFHFKDLPSDPAERDRVLLAALGSPDRRQIDGVGGGDTLTSKVCIVGPSSREDADVEFLFAQVSVDRAEVDTGPTCGNMTATVGPFALEEGLVPITGDETIVRIYNLNVGARVDAVIQTPGGRVCYSGDARIDGVPGTAAPQVLRFRDIMGSKCKSMLPTGQAQEVIQGVPVTCIDVAMPMVIMRAADLGKTGYETPQELDADTALLARMEQIRQEASQRMGLGDCTGKVTPKLALIAAPRDGGSITSRYFVPHKAHAAHAVTGAICVASCAALKGSVAEGLTVMEDKPMQWVKIEHPSGSIDVELAVEGSGANLAVVSGGVVRTARRLMAGNLYIQK